jgi:hypothetical protein
MNISRFNRYDLYAHSRVGMSCLVPLLTCGSETVFFHDRLYMKLTGHTLKGFGILKMFTYMIVSSVNGRLLVMWPRGNHNNLD